MPVVSSARKAAVQKLQESPANTGMSEMVNTRHDHKDRQEASGNNCEDVHSLAQVLNLPSDVASVLQPETSTVPNDQDSGAGVYSHLRVVNQGIVRKRKPARQRLNDGEQREQHLQLAAVVSDKDPH
ncbi:hypothetical protein C0Q70_05076 [Pomacea canaliculata]|uniref:Uncharacterized protein n=1 Tax=Pomacea canaliculata TaxID=400727 RepID=A0A2T7PK55_POMCA|nr:hypothetical protein C0Q70_05076 [Pomacea canaliculata]